MRAQRALTLLPGLVLLVGACSDSDSGDDAATTTTVAEATTLPDATTTASTAPTESTAATGSAPPTSAPPVDQAAVFAGLPWASPDDTHDDPIAAVEAFVEWMTATHEGVWTDGSFEIGAFAAGDARSGEVVIQSTVEAGPEPMSRPTTTVLVRQAGPDDAWWVLGAVADTLRIDEPAADALIESPLRVRFENTVISDPVEIRLYADAVDAPLAETTSSGSGVFAMGTFDILLGGGEPPTPGADPVEDWQGPPGATGTLVLSTGFGVTTVPVVFAG